MKKYPLNKDWQFSENSFGIAYPFGKPESVPVDLPHDFIITKPRSPQAAGGAANGFFGDGLGIYSKEMELPPEWNSKRIILDIDGAYMNTEVMLNGELLSLHPYGYTPFLVDLTPSIRYGAKNKFRITTQSRQPSSRWYAGGGLYRGAALWVGDPIHIEPWNIFVTTPCVEKDSAEVNANILVTNSSDQCCSATVRATILDQTGNAVKSAEKEIRLPAGEKAAVDMNFTVENPSLWDIESPTLYTLQTELLADNAVADTVDTVFGIRKIEVSPSFGFRLNGRTLKLKGGCIHHDNGALGACAYPRAEERKIQILKNAGYNAVRISHYPPSLAMLEVCDRLGMLLLDEAFDVWRKSKVPMDYHLYFEDWWERDIESMVLRDRNHPCVITYSIGNEIGERDGGSNGAEWSRKLAEKVRSLDNTRFVLSALCSFFDADLDMSNFDANLIIQTGVDDIWGEKTKEFAAPLDIVGYNYLYERYASDRQKFPDRVICGTETMSFKTYENWQAVLQNDHVIGDFIWTAFDNLGEAGVGRVFWPGGEGPGFLGEYPWRTCFQSDHDLCGFRTPQSYYREIMWGDRQAPVLYTTHPSHYGQEFSGLGWHWYDVKDSWSFDVEYSGKPVQVEVYGDGDKAAFFLNGKPMGESPVDKLIATMDIPYEPGVLEAIVYKAGQEVGKAVLTTTGQPTKIKLTPDRREIVADGLDLCYVTIEITDENGSRIPDLVTRLDVSVSGGGELAGLVSGNPKSEDPFGLGWCTSYEGRAIAVIKANTVGKMTITVSADEMESAPCVIQAASVQ